MSDFYTAGDYAGVSGGGYQFYYGYETALSQADDFSEDDRNDETEAWLFQVKRGKEVVMSKTAAEVGLGNRACECVEVLLCGISKWLDTVTISPKDNARNLAQNRLMWKWNADAGKAQGWNGNYQHGEWKHEVLLPMMKAWDDHHARAMEIQALLDYLPNRRMIIFACFDQVRSSDLSVKQFAEALTAYRDHYGQQGIILQSREDLIAQAIGEQLEQAT